MYNPFLNLIYIISCLSDVYNSLIIFFYMIFSDFKNLPFVGIYRMGTPCLLIRDPELYKCVAVKNFKNFYNNDIEIDKKVDPIFGKNAFALRGAEWKATRSTLTPCFTSQKVCYN